MTETLTSQREAQPPPPPPLELRPPRKVTVRCPECRAEFALPEDVTRRDRAARLLADFRFYLATPHRWSNVEFGAYRHRCGEFFDASDMTADEMISALRAASSARTKEEG